MLQIVVPGMNQGKNDSFSYCLLSLKLLSFTSSLTVSQNILDKKSKPVILSWRQSAEEGTLLMKDVSQSASQLVYNWIWLYTCDQNIYYSDLPLKLQKKMHLIRQKQWL